MWVGADCDPSQSGSATVVRPRSSAALAGPEADVPRQHLIDTRRLPGTTGMEDAELAAARKWLAERGPSR